MSRFSLLLLGLLAACIEAADKGEMGLDTGGAAQGSGASLLRVDVYPSSERPDLLPQTFELELPASGVELALGRPVTLWGRVTGYVSTPYLGIHAPGEERPLAARVSAERPGTVLGGAAETSPEDGAFSFQVAPSTGYTFSVVPEDDPTVPFYVLDEQDFEVGHYFDLALGYGELVTGQVTVSGRGRAGLSVQAVESSSGVEGPVAETDDDGYYVLRLNPGRYELRVFPSGGEALPTVSTFFEVEEGGFTELDVDLGSPREVSLRGTVVDAEGEPVEDVTVRAVSKTLDELDGSLVTETKTDQNGRYSLDLLEGRFLLTFLPPYERALTARQEVVDLAFTPGVQDLGEIALDGFVSVSAQLRDEAGHPLPSVGVTVEDGAFTGYSWSAVTDEEGRFSISVPDGVLDFSFTPGTDELAVAWGSWEASDLPAALVLSRGQAMDGRVVGPEGDPVPYALLEFWEGSRRLASTLCDQYGRFSLRIAGGPVQEAELQDTGYDTGLE